MHDFIGLFDANSIDLSHAHKLSERLHPCYRQRPALNSVNKKIKKTQKKINRKHRKYLVFLCPNTIILKKAL